MNRDDSTSASRRQRPRLSPVERAWLEARLREYRDLLRYLRDH